MVARGSKPKPAALRLVDGSHRPARHGSVEAAKEAAAQAIERGKPVMPKDFTGEAKKCWKDNIERWPWIDASKQVAAVGLCELWEEFRFHPRGFAAAKHGQMRAYMAELGLTDERNRKMPKDGTDENDFF